MFWARPELSEAKSNRLRPDQWRLIGGGGLPVLRSMLAELLGYHGVLIPLLAVPAVAIGGIQGEKPKGRCAACKWDSES